MLSATIVLAGPRRIRALPSAAVALRTRRICRCETICRSRGPSTSASRHLDVWDARLARRDGARSPARAAHERHANNRFDRTERRRTCYGQWWSIRNQPRRAPTWSIFLEFNRAAAAATIACGRVMAGFSSACVWSAGTSVVAIRRKTATRCDIFARPPIPSRAPSSQARSGPGATSTSYGSRASRCPEPLGRRWPRGVQSRAGGWAWRWQIPAMRSRSHVCASSSLCEFCQICE